MTVPIPVRDVAYSTDALRARIDDLTMALNHLMATVVSSSTWTVDGPARIAATERARALAAELERVRHALVSVWTTIHPAEKTRVDSLGAATQSLASYVMSGPFGVGYAAWSGQLWPAIRPLAEQVLEIVPRGVPNDSTVTVVAREAHATTPPDSLRARIERIPTGNTHIRIERFVAEDGNRFEVYLSGTNFTGTETDPWNAKSNIELVTTGSAPSLRAVKEAMLSAGITSTTPVVLTGHSQGGLIALAIGATHEFDVTAIVTVGTPVGAVPDVRDVPTIHIVHPEDPVPAFGGLIDPDSSTWVIPVTGGERLFAAHHRQSYEPSADALDNLHDPRIDALRAQIQSTGVGVRRDYQAVVSRGPHRGTDAG
ncbi:MAG: hypothetical protein ACKOWN_05795 [Microbacteriaceae bacterium]